jgi:predicted transposase YdaD
MVDYRLRIYHLFPKKLMRQVVVYLIPTDSELVRQTTFEMPGIHAEFEVIRIWEQPTQPFLESAGLSPLAVLTQTLDKVRTLKQVALVIDAIPEQFVRSNLAASAGILAGLTLDRDSINQVMRN